MEAGTLLEYFVWRTPPLVDTGPAIFPFGLWAFYCNVGTEKVLETLLGGGRQGEGRKRLVAGPCVSFHFHLWHHGRYLGWTVSTHHNHTAGLPAAGVWASIGFCFWEKRLSSWGFCRFYVVGKRTGCFSPLGGWCTLADVLGVPRQPWGSGTGFLTPDYSLLWLPALANRAEGGTPPRAPGLWGCLGSYFWKSWLLSVLATLSEASTSLY